MIGLLAVVIVIVAVTLYKFSGRQILQTANQNQTNFVKPFQSMRLTRLTSSGKVKHAAISPDGKYVVHVVQDGEHESLWMKQVSSPASEVQIRAPEDLSYLGLTFSPSGDEIYFNAWDRKNPQEPFTLYRMPTLGGATGKLVSDIDSLVTFSPDGQQMAYMRGSPIKGELALLVANNDGTAERTIGSRKLPARMSLVGPAWSPDGKSIVYSVDSVDGALSYVTLIERQLGDGSEKRITSKQWWRVERLVWMRDGSGLILVAREEIGSPSQIWYLSYPSGQANRITNDLKDYYTVSLTADTSALLTVESEQIANIWVLPNDNLLRAKQITTSKFDGSEGLSWTPDGKIVYASRASDKLDLWIIKADGTAQKQLTTNSGNNRRPSVSSDGRYIVFTSDRTGTDHIWRINIDGSDARQLTNGEGERNAVVSPDSQWVLYQLMFSRTGVWRVAIDGGEAKQLVDKPTRGIAISPDSKLLASAYFEPRTIKTAIYNFEGGEPLKIFDFNGMPLCWTRDGRALAYVDQRRTPTIVSSQPIDGGQQKQIDFSPDRVFGFAWSNDGKSMAVARGSLIQDVILISNAKEQ